MKVLRFAWFLGAVLLLSGCLGIPEGVVPVQGVDTDRYLGKWYEIARLDHSFERGMSQVSAEYSLRDDGGIRVINRGFKAADDEWREAEGRAYFVAQPDEGYLKVSFFGPFYGSYVIFELDKADYQYAFVAGNSREYLWLLARTPEISDELKAEFVHQATELGFATDELIWVTQSASDRAE
ncbi:lipocalin family protein [Corallincola spongiicola]|uniref:Outer membrane lipoprotein Blc n=1 Tax=Corallincola spongiicola TaxID=2520508 RepID=A0ABY1WS25_9GAMM|nr:lipocalin family protein [Corallincola spongiicola]TAA47383.1 lipocalin [Corallincola spongiicola]